MKLVIPILTALLGATSALAADRPYFKAVLDSDALTGVLAEGAGDWELKSLEHTATFRCPGCFEFQARVGRYDAATGGEETFTVKLGTSLDFTSGDISVSLVAPD